MYRATDSRLNRSVAIKFLSAQFSDRFEREAKAIAALNHPNICQIYDIGPTYLVMEYVDGSPVVSPDQQPLPTSEVLRLAGQIASALQAAHAQGIIHRDLKPANILVSTTGTVKLLDFGLAKRTAGTDPAQTADLSQTMGVTQPGTIMGHPVIEAAIARAHSATSLRPMLTDPLGFVWGYALGWKPPSPLSQEEPLALDNLTYGILVHELLRLTAAFLELNGGFAVATQKQVESAIAEAIIRVAREWELTKPPPPRLLWQRTLTEARDTVFSALMWR